MYGISEVDKKDDSDIHTTIYGAPEGSCGIHIQILLGSLEIL